MSLRYVHKYREREREREKERETEREREREGERDRASEREILKEIERERESCCMDFDSTDGLTCAFEPGTILNRNHAHRTERTRYNGHTRAGRTD